MQTNIYTLPPEFGSNMFSLIHRLCANTQHCGTTTVPEGWHNVRMDQPG